MFMFPIPQVHYRKSIFVRPKLKNIKGFIYLSGKTKLRAFAFSTPTTTRHITTTTSVPTQNKTTKIAFREKQIITKSGNLYTESRI